MIIYGNDRSNKKSIGYSLLGMVMVAVLPLLVFGSAVSWMAVNQRKVAVAEQLAGTTQALLVAVDRELLSQLAAMDVLAIDPSLDTVNFTGFHDVVQRFLQVHTEWENVVLIDPVTHVLVAGGLQMPATVLRSSTIPEVDQVVSTRKAMVVGLRASGKVTKKPFIQFLVPVMRNDKVLFVLGVAVSPARMNDILSNQKLPASWTGAVIDNHLILAGRSRYPERYVAKRATDVLANRIAASQSGMFVGINQEGEKGYNLFSSSATSHWSVVIAIPSEEVDAPIRSLLTNILLGGGGLIALALILTSIIGFYIVRQRDAYELSLRLEGDKSKRLAFYDTLTNLPNRRLVLEHLNNVLASSKVHKACGALLLIDLDHFKKLNDTFGNTVGDQLLIEAAHRLTSTIRSTDFVARLVGDEFVLILENLGDSDQATRYLATVVEKIQAVLGLPYVLDVSLDRAKSSTRSIQGTSSIGIALFNDAPMSVDELLKRADTAMYQAKAAGRNTYRFFDLSVQQALAARAALELDLHHAVVGNQFVLHYQPQVDASGRVTGAEALVRWQHPEHGQISPGMFISLAEETGLILPLGQWVLDTACAQLAAWANNPDLSDITLAVNVSARQIGMPDFVSNVLASIEKFNAPPAKLKLEMTESLLLENTGDIIAKMTALKARGLGFSLDDFGTGYSSLSYLKRLPLDQLKIDQSFVREVLTDANDAAIARTVVALGLSLGLSVIAEGVETKEQCEFLANSGCFAYQGYLFSRPVPLADFELYTYRANGRSGPATAWHRSGN